MSEGLHFEVEGRPFWNQSPRLALLEITTYCNLKCDYCIRSVVKGKNGMLSLEQFNTVRNRLHTISKVTLCGMGETMLHPNLYDMVSAFSGHGIGIITNGTISIDFSRLSKSGNLKVVTFSIDGPDEETCRTICRNYNFDVLRENLSRAARYPDIKRGLNCVIGKANLHLLDQMIDLAERYEIQAINMILPFYEQNWVKANIGAINEQFRVLEQKAQDKDIYWIDPYAPQCEFEGASVPIVSSDGSVRPCCDCYNHVPVVGNLFEESFEELWNSPAYQLFRAGKFCLTCARYHNLGLSHYRRSVPDHDRLEPTL